MSQPTAPARAVTVLWLAVVLASLAAIVLTMLGWSHLAICMSDRLAAHGGTLDVRSQPGRGTTIIGWLPAPAHQPRTPGTRMSASPAGRTGR